MPPIPTWSLLAFALLLTTLSTALSRSHRHQQSCSSSCGAISNITYPFWINSDPVECGDGDYELVCEDNQTMLEIGHGKFLVKNISYAENLIRVVDAELAKGSCGMPLTMQFDYLLIGDNRYMLTGSTVESVYVNCSRKVLNENYTEVPCLSGNQSYVYVVYDYSLSEIIASLNESCEAVATVMSDKVGRKDRSYENIVKVLQSGFELGWNIECRDCHRSGGFCVHIEHSRTVICEKTDAAEIVHLLINLISTIVGTLFFYGYLVARFFISPIVLLVFLAYLYATRTKNADMPSLDTQPEAPGIPKEQSNDDSASLHPGPAKSFI